MLMEIWKAIIMLVLMLSIILIIIILKNKAVAKLKDKCGYLYQSECLQFI